MSDDPEYFEDDEIDGCECAFPDEDATLDEELPVADGGVE